MMATVTVRQAVRAIEADGWYLVHQKGSHRQYHHPSKPGTVTVAGNVGKTLKAGTWASIRRQAGI